MRAELVGSHPVRSNFSPIIAPAFASAWSLLSLSFKIGFSVNVVTKHFSRITSDFAEVTTWLDGVKSRTATASKSADHNGDAGECEQRAHGSNEKEISHSESFRELAASPG